MELGLASPNKKEKMMQMKQYQAQAAPLAPQEKGVVGQMGDMAKQRAMKGALDQGQSAIMGAIPSAGAANAAALAANPATMGMGGAEVALAGQAMGGAGAGAGLAGAGGMAALGTAVPYVGAGLLAGKALGLFNEGGMVGPLSTQYNAQGTMTEEQARALMMNQLEPMTEISQEQIPMPMSRPMLSIDPFGADKTFNPYDMIRPDNVPST